MKIARDKKIVNPDCINPNNRVINFLASMNVVQQYMIFERVNIFVEICFLTGTLRHNARFCVFIQARATRSICA